MIRAVTTKRISLKPQLLVTCACLLLTAWAGSATTLPSYTGGIYGDALSAHDGKLRWAVGVQNVQVSRSAPENPGATDGSTTLYRHHQMLADPLFCQQWQEEDQDPNFYTISTEIIPGVREWKAFNWYRLADNRIVGAWKKHYMVVSTGTDWTRDSVPAPVEVTSFGFNPSAKVWGTRTEDGRYAFVGCTPGKPGGDLHRRWPLAVTTSRDGLTFDRPYLAIAGDMPPQRYENAAGDDKNSGPQYVRGICPGNGDPPGRDLWLTYSMNKEDIWVACVPTPIEERVDHDVRDHFQNPAPGRSVPGWNTYSPQWAPVAIAAEGTNRFLRLEDRDACDYASAMRVFPQSIRARLAFQVRAHQNGSGTAPLEMDVVSFDGVRAGVLSFNPVTGQIMAWNGDTPQSLRSYPTGAWTSVEILVDCMTRRYDLNVDGNAVLAGAAFLEPAASVERIVFRTGAFRLRDYGRRPHVDGTWLTSRIPNADVLQATSWFDIDNVACEKQAPPPRE